MLKSTIEVAIKEKQNKCKRLVKSFYIFLKTPEAVITVKVTYFVDKSYTRLGDI